MLTYKQIMFFLCALWGILASAIALPDGGETHPEPGPGLAYGGIPYGSVSGNVAEFFKHQAPPLARAANFAPVPPYKTNNVDFAPIEQWL